MTTTTNQPPSSHRSLAATLLQYTRFAMSGGIGNALFFLCYDLIISLCPLQRGCATSSWLLSYLLSIIWQHALHTFLVFGLQGQSYWRSLGWTYVSYTASFVLSTALNWILVENLHVPNTWAWGITLAATGPISYISLKATAFNSQKQGAASADKEAKKQ